MNDVFLKICGLTRLDDAWHAVDEGATALGFVLWPRSPRFVAAPKVAEMVAALPVSVATVGVFVNASPEEIALTMRETGLTMVQLHGDEPAAYAERLDWLTIKAVTLDGVPDDAEAWPAETMLLVDAFDPVRRGGTGQSVDWTKAAALARRRRVVLAGGLTPDNVESALLAVQPHGVDVSSGVEDAPGIKNATKVTRFLRSARKAMAYLQSAEGAPSGARWRTYGSQH